jgi:hypothetical protein
VGTALWVVQVLLAVGFLVSGATEPSRLEEKPVKTYAWMEDVSQPA